MIAPPALTFRFPDTVEAPRSIAFVSVTVTLLPLVIATVVKSLLVLPSVMLLPAPAANVAVFPAPFTVRLPLCVIAPPAVTVMFPVSVVVGRMIPVLSDRSVRFRKFVSPPSAGIAAAASILRKPRSCTFVGVPPMATVPLKSFA